MKKQIKDKQTIIAETLVNQRVMRNGSPALTNPLDILPPRLLNEVMEDAKEILKALGINNAKQGE